MAGGLIDRWTEASANLRTCSVVLSASSGMRRKRHRPAEMEPSAAPGVRRRSVCNPVASSITCVNGTCLVQHPPTNPPTGLDEDGQAPRLVKGLQRREHKGVGGHVPEPRQRQLDHGDGQALIEAGNAALLVELGDGLREGAAVLVLCVCGWVGVGWVGVVFARRCTPDFDG